DAGGDGRRHVARDRRRRRADRLRRRGDGGDRRDDGRRQVDGRAVVRADGRRRQNHGGRQHEGGDESHPTSKHGAQGSESPPGGQGLFRSGSLLASGVYGIMSPRMKVHFTTLGCPKNQVDSELMQGMLTQAGHELTDAAGSAECLIVNTCAFIDRAREESVNTILELARVKETGRARALIVTGCLTQRYGNEILKELPEVDGILGTSNLSRIVELRSEEHTSELQ